MGAINVLPDDGFVNLCVDVYADGEGTYGDITTEYGTQDYTDMMTEVSTMMTYVY